MSMSHATVESRASGGLSGSGQRRETDAHQDSAKADETNQKSFASQGDQGFDKICGLKNVKNCYSCKIWRCSHFLVSNFVDYLRGGQLSS